MTRVLIVDDELDVCDYLAEVLQREGFVTETLQDPAKVLSTVEQFQPEVVLVDYRMPGMGGIDVLRTLRAQQAGHAMAMIVISGMSGEEEKVLALEIGADDFVVKPISPKELAARIRAVLRRRSDFSRDEKLQVDGLMIDLVAHKVLQDGQEVYLTLTEFRILAELVRHLGRVLSRDKLRETALANLSVTDRTIDVHMASLRKKLVKYAPAIQTVRGVGYRYAHETSA